MCPKNCRRLPQISIFKSGHSDCKHSDGHSSEEEQLKEKLPYSVDEYLYKKDIQECKVRLICGEQNEKRSNTELTLQGSV